MTRSPILPKASIDYPETIDNRAVLEVLETLQDKLSTTEVAGYTVPIDSRESLRQLELEKDNLSAIIASIGIGSFVTGLTTFSIAWLGLLLAWKPATRLEKVARLTKLISMILEEYEDAGVETLPLIQVPQYQPIDLFVRFPGKEFILFAVRSFGNSKIVYNERKSALYYKRSKKGLQKWIPDPMLELSEQAYWIRKNRRDLFGSSKGVRKPMAKVLVVWDQTQLSEHQEHLYATVGGQKFLFIPREEGASYAIHSTQVLDFIRAWLNHRQSPEKSSEVK